MTNFIPKATTIALTLSSFLFSSVCHGSESKTGLIIASGVNRTDSSFLQNDSSAVHKLSIRTVGNSTTATFQYVYKFDVGFHNFTSENSLFDENSKVRGTSYGYQVGLCYSLIPNLFNVCPFLGLGVYQLRGDQNYYDFMITQGGIDFEVQGPGKFSILISSLQTSYGNRVDGKRQKSRDQSFLLGISYLLGDESPSQVARQE